MSSFLPIVDDLTPVQKSHLDRISIANEFCMQFDPYWTEATYYACLGAMPDVDPSGTVTRWALLADNMTWDILAAILDPDYSNAHALFRFLCYGWMQSPLRMNGPFQPFYVHADDPDMYADFLTRHVPEDQKIMVVHMLLVQRHLKLAHVLLLRELAPLAPPLDISEVVRRRQALLCHEVELIQEL